VWSGILAAEAAGMTPIKLNAVVVHGYNEPDVVDLARLTIEKPWQMRFIEMMPFAGATDLQLSRVVTANEIHERIESEFGQLQVANGGKLDGEARLYRIPGAAGEIGFISSVTVPFCAACTRARLTADGRLRLCLLREGEVDLLTPLRAGAGLDELRQIILDGIWEKPWGHGLAEGVIPLNRVMSEIGG
jgi:cyclic pyranopterin phosphate synthase